MIKGIIFDLDGTLLNTLNDLADSVNHVLRSNNMKERTVDEVRRFVGNGIPTLMKRAAEDGTDEKTLKKITDEMLLYYKDHARNKTAPYEGIPELIRELNAMGIKTAVVTNKAENAAKILCDSMFGNVFTAVIGDNGVSPLKPAPDNVLRAIDKMQLKKENILYVGDSDVDMETAKNAELISVGVLWGFRDREILEKAGADHIIEKPLELLNLL